MIYPHCNNQIFITCFLKAYQKIVLFSSFLEPGPNFGARRCIDDWVAVFFMSPEPLGQTEVQFLDVVLAQNLPQYPREEVAILD